MKILITAPYLKTAGILHCVDALTPYLGDVDIIRRGKQRTNDCKIKTGLIQLCIYLKFISKITVKDYNVVIINTSVGFYTSIRDGIFVIIAKIFRKKTILYIHGYKKLVINHKLPIWGYFFSDKIIVLSKELKDKLKSVGYKKGIYSTYNPVDISIIEEDFSNKHQDIINLLFMARMEKEKGIIIALEAYKLAKEIHKNIIFNIAGDGKYIDKAKQFSLANKLKDVKFHGFLHGNKKLSLLKISHILIAPTYHDEGLSIATLEAMTAGLSIVSRPVGGIKDFFENGKMGYLIESLDPKEFADGILNSINNMHSISKYNMEFGKMEFQPEEIANYIYKISDMNTIK